MQEISSIKQKILQYIEYKGITKYKFYQETGITRGILDHTGGMSEENMLKFFAQYPEVNPIWLITGRGYMITPVHADTGVAGENLLAQTPASAPATAIEAPTVTKAPKMGNYAADRIIEEKQKAYERQIAEMKEELMNAYMKIGYLTAEKEELKASLDTKPADHAGDATGVPVLKDKAS